MSLCLLAEEPAAGPWHAERLTAVAADIDAPGTSSRGADRRPTVLAINGRSNNGKTTLAARISDLVPGSVVIHTDDIAWAHSRFGWADLLIDDLLVPVHHGQAVSYRTPRWDEHGREGSLKIPVSCPLLIIEGDGAGRREVAHLIDVAIWVQSDERETERRNLARVGQPDGPPAEQDHREWMAEEIPFQASQRPWERADLIICGTPRIPC